MSIESVPKQLADAIEAEDCKSILRLLRENPDQLAWHTPFGSQTWLGYAAQIGKVKAAECLIEAGVDINAGDKRENRKPICSAAANGHYEMVSFLLERGAEIDVSLSVRNPLFAAIVGRSVQITKLLLTAGIDSAVSYTSNTMRDMDAVAFALMRGETECARVIASWKAEGNGAQTEEMLSAAYRVAEENAFQRHPT